MQQPGASQPRDLATGSCDSISAPRTRRRQHLAAVLDACRLRLRPILMTSLAFMMGVVFSGMLGVTFFGLLLTPVVYLAVSRLTRSRRAAAAVPLIPAIGEI